MKEPDKRYLFSSLIGVVIMSFIFVILKVEIEIGLITFAVGPPLGYLLNRFINAEDYKNVYSLD